MGKVLNKRAPAKSSKAGRKLLAAFQQEFDRIEAGGAKFHSVRTIELPDDPSLYAPADVAKLRAKVGVSQAVFARLVGSSTILISAWEQGKREPNRMARRLLDEINADPNKWAAMVKPDRVTKIAM